MSENKTSKYLKYAIGEVLLVMIGILLAFQVNNWRDQNLASKEEKKIISLLKEGLKYNYEGLEIFQSQLKNSEEKLKHFMLELGKDNYSDSLINHVRGSLNLYLYKPIYPTYKGLVQDGNLDLIRNDSIRSRIVGYFDVNIKYLEDLLSSTEEYNTRVREVIEPYFGFELSEDSTWTYSSMHNIDQLKQDHHALHILGQYGKRCSFMITRVDSLFLTGNRRMHKLLSDYLTALEK